MVIAKQAMAVGSNALVSLADIARGLHSGLSDECVRLLWDISRVTASMARDVMRILDRVLLDSMPATASPGAVLAKGFRDIESLLGDTMDHFADNHALLDGLCPVV